MPASCRVPCLLASTTYLCSVSSVGSSSFLPVLLILGLHVPSHCFYHQCNWLPALNFFCLKYLELYIFWLTVMDTLPCPVSFPVCRQLQATFKHSLLNKIMIFHYLSLDIREKFPLNFSLHLIFSSAGRDWPSWASRVTVVSGEWGWSLTKDNGSHGLLPVGAVLVVVNSSQARDYKESQRPKAVDSQGERAMQGLGVSTAPSMWSGDDAVKETQVRSKEEIRE